VKSRQDIAKMRRAGRIVAEVLALVESELKPGITTGRLDALAEAHIRASGGIPSFQHYLGGGRYSSRDPHAFPASTCISIDDEVVHGIPGPRRIEAGSVVSVDTGAIVEGWHADGARTFIVGDVDPKARELVETTRLGMMAGIAAATPGHRIGDIGAAVEDVARPHGYGIVRQFVGHGIGTSMHEDPQVPNYRVKGHQGAELKAGMCLAIEPMYTLGSGDVYMRDDGWTIATDDGTLAVHFEHTIAITDNGPEILTTV
jgi:methionyl aminopeptidase